MNEETTINKSAQDRQREIWLRLQAGAQSAPALTAAQEREIAQGTANAAWIGPGAGAMNAAPYSRLSEKIIPEPRPKTWADRLRALLR